MRMDLKPGTVITIKAKVIAPTSGSAYMIETPSGPVRIHSDMIVATDVQEVTEGAPVQSTMPHRIGIVGMVLAIDHDEAWVRWQEGPARTEKLNTLTVHQMNPA